MADQFLALLEPRKPEIMDMLGGVLDDEKQRFIALAIRAVSDPKFDRCTNESKLDCVIQAAVCKLELGTADKLAWLIPYGNVLSFQPSYIGKRKRVIESGVAEDVYAELVYENDEFDEISGAERKIVHKPLRFKDRGRLVGAYAVSMHANGRSNYEILEEKDLDAIEKAALRISGGKPSPAWQYFKGEMQKKSAMHRLMKRLVGVARKHDPRLEAVLEADERNYEFETMRTAEEQEPDLPTAVVREAHVEVVEDKPKPKPAAKKPETAVASEKPIETDRQITLVEATELSDLAESLSLTFKTQKAVLVKLNVGDFEELKLSQLEQAGKLLQEAAG